MKKLLIFALVLMLLCGCSKAPAKDDSPVKEPASSENVQSEKPIHTAFSGGSVEDIMAQLDSELGNLSDKQDFEIRLLEWAGEQSFKFADVEGGSYWLNILPETENNVILPDGEIHYAAGVVCTVGGRVYDLIVTDDFEHSFNVDNRSYIESKTYGDIAVEFSGYSLGEEAYITMIEWQLDGLRLLMIPNHEDYFVRGSEYTRIFHADIKATEEFFDSLSEDIFKVSIKDMK